MLKKILRRILSKAGLLTHSSNKSLGSFRDIESRQFLADKIVEAYSDYSEINALMLGSPGVDELSLLPPDFLKKLNIVSIDLSEERAHQLDVKVILIPK